MVETYFRDGKVLGRPPYLPGWLGGGDQVLRGRAGPDTASLDDLRVGHPDTVAVPDDRAAQFDRLVEDRACRR